ncbi:hypothetical protein [Nocardia gipuzkoensis]|uniref:hypothetical protein n=1 Tax=Nocardia gipuzkoensis TaxID=2749991 RepID=UPI00237D841D|nr:hypothetical protein [Nocardia gipuzkoensis]MDE1674696.1 hypothetical protein [Nocardia gipuzkoensis]
MFSRAKTPPDAMPVVDASAEVQALADRLDSARGRRDLLRGDAATVLVEVPSEKELAAVREQAEWRREELRKAARAELSEQLAAAEALRQANKTIRDADIRDAIDARKALAEQRRADTPASTVAELHRYSRWTRYGCAAIIAAGMVWSAINVQHNMAPGGKTDPLFWASFLVEGMISGLLVIIALGTAKVRDAAGLTPSSGTRWAEIGLFLLTLGLNTYPYVRQSHWYDAGLHAIAPAMIGATLLVLHSLGADYAEARRVVAERITDTDLTVHLPSLPSVQTAQPTVHGEGSYPTAQPETEHRATVHPEPVSDTAHRAPVAASDTVHRAPVVPDDTVQSPRTAQPQTAHRAAGADATRTDVYTVQHEVRTVQHTEQPRTVTGVDASRPDTLGSLEEDAVAESDTAVGAAPLPERTDWIVAEKPAVEADSSVETEHPVTGVEQSAEATPSTVQPGTEQFASTVHPDAVGDTEHRAAEPETVHPDADTVQHTEQPETVHRAPEAATERHTAVDDTEMWVLAAEVHSRLRRTKFSVEDIARVLIAHRRQGLGVDRIYRDKIGPHRSVTTNWLEWAEQIEQERAAEMAPVITLRERG